MSEPLNITASGVLSEPLESLRSILVASASFRDWVGAQTDDEAESKVFIEGVDVQEDDEIAAIRPYALVAFESFGDSMLGYFSGTIVLCLESNVAVEHSRTHQEAMFAFMNKVGAIANEIKAASLAPGALIIRTISSLRRPARSGVADAEGDYAQQWLRIEYGLEN